MRPILALLVVLLALSISGISSAIAAHAGDDCCADGAGEVPSDQRSDDDRDTCPPLCHACACSPAFAVPAAPAPVIHRTFDRARPSTSGSQLPTSPSLPGVFHPPRCGV